MGTPHGAEMPVDASGLEFGLAFLLATGILHLIGIGLGIGLVAERYSERLAQVSGAGIAIVGFLLSVRIL
jgi:urease accessory protein